VFGSVGDAHVLRQVRPKGAGGHGVRLRDGRSAEQHNDKRVRSDPRVHVFRVARVQPDQDPVRADVQAVSGGAIQPQSNNRRPFVAGVVARVSARSIRLRSRGPRNLNENPIALWWLKGMMGKGR